MPSSSLGSSHWRQLYLERLVAMTPWLASPRSWASGDPFLVPADFYKALVRNLVVVAGLGLQWRRLGRLLAQPTPHAEPASSAGSRGNPWDASRQVPLPLAYPGGHPHDTCPQNWRSLMELHGALAGSFPLRSSFTSIEVPGIHIRLENCLNSRSTGYLGRLRTCWLPDQTGLGLAHGRQPESGSLELELLEIRARAPLVCKPQ
jgi:hypothetical protein